jgi:hypothetical protein
MYVPQKSPSPHHQSIISFNQMNNHTFASMQASRTRSRLVFRPKQTNASEEVGAEHTRKEQEEAEEEENEEKDEEDTCLFFLLAVAGAWLLAARNPNAFAPFLVNAVLSRAFPTYGGPKDRAWVQGGFVLVAFYVAGVVCSLRV